MVDQVHGLAVALRGGVRFPDRGDQVEHLLSFSTHAGCAEHELRQRVLDVRRQRPVLVFQQVVHELPRIDAHHEVRHLPGHVVLAGRGRRNGLAFLPFGQRVPAQRVSGFEPFFHRAPGVGAAQEFAHLVVFGAIHAGQRPVGAVDGFEILDVILGTKKQPRIAVDPSIGLGPDEQDRALLDHGRLEFHHGPVLAVEKREIPRHVASSQQVPVEQIAQRDDRDRPRRGAAPGNLQRDEALPDGLLDGPADHFQVADEGDSRLCGLEFVGLHHEPERLADIEQADEQDVPRIGNPVVIYPAEDALPNLLLVVGHTRRPVRASIDDGACAGPEATGVRQERALRHQSVQHFLDPFVGAETELLRPVPGAVRFFLRRDPLKRGVENGVARGRAVEQNQLLQVQIDAPAQRQFAEHGSGECAFEIPEVQILQIAAIIIQQDEDQFVHQREFAVLDVHRKQSSGLALTRSLRRPVGTAQSCPGRSPRSAIKRHPLDPPRRMRRKCCTCRRYSNSILARLRPGPTGCVLPILRRPPIGT